MRDLLLHISYMLVPWLAVWLWGERARFREAVPAGLLMVALTTTLDELGVHAGLWAYPAKPFSTTAVHIPFNWLSFNAEAILINQKALAQPGQTWAWVAVISLGNAAAEEIALRYSSLLAYPRWSPWYSIPVYVLLFWLTIWFTRWLWRPRTLSRQ